MMMMFIFYYDPTTAKITRQGFFTGSQPLQVVWVTVHDYNSVYMCMFDPLLYCKEKFRAGHYWTSKD